jgi:hypothetical protein
MKGSMMILAEQRLETLVVWDEVDRPLFIHPEELLEVL